MIDMSLPGKFHLNIVDSQKRLWYASTMFQYFLPYSKCQLKWWILCSCSSSYSFILSTLAASMGAKSCNWSKKPPKPLEFRFNIFTWSNLIYSLMSRINTNFSLFWCNTDTRHRRCHGAGYRFVRPWYASMEWFSCTRLDETLPLWKRLIQSELTPCDHQWKQNGNAIIFCHSPS